MSYSPKAKITDWISFTPTGLWTQNTTYSGKYRRIGNTCEVWIDVMLSGNPNAATFTVEPPSGLTIDSNKINNATLGPPVGIAIIYEDTVAVRGGATVCYSSASSVFYIRAITTAPNTVTDVTNTAPMSFGVNDRIFMLFSFPVEEWA